MNPYVIGQFVGAFVGCFAFSRILWLLTRNWPGSYGKAAFLNGIFALLAVGWASVGLADGGPPKVVAAASIYLPCQGLVFLIDSLLIWRRRHKKQLDSELVRREPQF